MKVQARVFQFIKWEDRNKYFWCVDWNNDGEYDLLHCGVEEKVAWWKVGLIGMFIQLPLQLKNKNLGGYSQDGFAFNTYKGFPIWVKRPHEFKKGDLVEVEVTVKAVLSQQKFDDVSGK